MWWQVLPLFIHPNKYFTYLHICVLSNHIVTIILLFKCFVLNNKLAQIVHFILNFILNQHLKRGASTFKTYLPCYEQVLREETYNSFADQDIKKHLIDRKVQVKTDPHLENQLAEQMFPWARVQKIVRR